MTEVTAVDVDEGENGKFHYELHATNLFKNGANQSSGSLSRSPFVVNAQTGRVQMADFISLYSQDKFELRIVAVENAPPNRETEVRVYVSENVAPPGFERRDEFANRIFVCRLRFGCTNCSN